MVQLSKFYGNKEKTLHDYMKNIPTNHGRHFNENDIKKLAIIWNKNFPDKPLDNSLFDILIELSMNERKAKHLEEPDIEDFELTSIIDNEIVKPKFNNGDEIKILPHLCYEYWKKKRFISIYSFEENEY